METKETGIKENKMGVMPVGKLVFNMSFPMMVSMLVQALYNIVDSIFVANMAEGEAALTAVSLAFPLQSLLIAVGAGTGVGVNALLSRALGEGNRQKTEKVAANGGLLYLISYVVFLVLGLTVVKPFYASQVVEASQQNISDMGVTYLTIVMTMSFGLMGQFYFERLLTSTGKTVYSMLCQLVGAITNIILDPIFIFGYFGVPAMGVAGAAIATVIGQCVAAVIGVICNFRFNHELKVSFRGFRPDGRTIASIYMIGVPSIIMQSIGSIMVYCMNRVLISFTSTATTVFGVYFKLQSFFFMPVFGLNNGITPIIAYNYGAGNRKRMIRTIRVSMVVAFCLLMVGFLGFELIPQVLLGFFKPSEEMLRIGCKALRIIGVHFLIAWFCIVAGTVFQALGKAIYSMIVSIMRQLGVLIPAAIILSHIGGLEAVWWAFPIAELMSLLVSTICLIHVYRTIIKKIPEGTE